MIKRTVAIALVATSLVVVGSSAVAHAPAELRGTKAALTASDRARLAVLKSIGGWVYYPASVPERFQLNTVEVKAGDRDPNHRDYVLRYCGTRTAGCFEIESTAGGIGDVAGKGDIRPLNVVSPYFGKFTVWARGRGGETDYLSDWLEDPAMRATRNGGGTPRHDVIARFHHLTGAGITDSEAVTVAESLKPLR